MVGEEGLGAMLSGVFSGRTYKASRKRPREKIVMARV